eukprot:11761088-Ditylum_brightwellii.AAC.2
MIATVTKNNLTSESWCHLMLKKEEFTLTKLDDTEVFDGLTLIWAEVKALKAAKLLGCGNDPLKMLDSMEL